MKLYPGLVDFYIRGRIYTIYTGKRTSESISQLSDRVLGDDSISIIEALKDEIQGEKLALNGHQNKHEKLNSSYPSPLESDISPSAIFLPNTKEDVLIFLKAYPCDWG
ncbi:hypothetical protein TEQG_05390 [Trichophyton equinum CBS 127.97]|uniref:Uncharacterized protein n=1 Tax=Trichophyton equinum (strain ATCC MYA-4606 / CBS 127.97) TaxID=559882 RepID=F2PWW9_TRIEC|nr:hypothetical protein TEQG_05390 [Trichophyton equinum CBS 127.97]